MKSEKLNKFKNGYARLIILTILSVSAGLGMLIAPEKTDDWVIRGVGLIWTLEGISYGLSIWKKYLENRR
jgi:1,4-dihydroxy-2-naphthoate octaprenyltransferase